MTVWDYSAIKVFKYEPVVSLGLGLGLAFGLGLGLGLGFGFGFGCYGKVLLNNYVYKNIILFIYIFDINSTYSIILFDLQCSSV